MKNKFVQRVADSNDVNNLINVGYTPWQANALASRGVTVDNLREYFDCNVHHDVSLMPNLVEVAEIISDVMRSGGSILIYGDYDADGLTASSILSLFFSDNGVDNDVVIPSRNEGYGMHVDNVMRAYDKKYYDLIITVDCGISNREEIAQLQDELGVEIIVTDHHELPDVLPDCLCVNPKMGYPFAYLAGAGVALKVVEAVAGREVALNYATLASIGTIADVMPLVDENRTIVSIGLGNINHCGINKLAELCKCKTVTASDVSMKIAPKINAAGRIGNANIALDLLLARDKTDVAKAQALMDANEKRIAMLNNIISEAEKRLDFKTVKRERMVFLYGDNWAHGLLGIAASRFRELYKLPAMFLTRDGDNYVGSARCDGDIDLHSVFCSCEDILVRHGGHKSSVGFTVTKDNLELLRNRLSEKFNSYDDSVFENLCYYDMELSDEVTLKEIMDFDNAIQPVLTQDKIVIRAKGNVKFVNIFGKDSSHVGFTLDNGLEFKAFNGYTNYVPYLRLAAEVDVLCTLDTDSYSGNVCAIVDDISLCNSLKFDEEYVCNLLESVTTKHVEYEQNVELTGRTLLVFDDCASFLKYAESNNLEEYFVEFFVHNCNFDNVVAISPKHNYNYDEYDTVVVFTSVPLKKCGINNAHYVHIDCDEALYELNMTRDECALTYNCIKRKQKFDSIKGAYDKYLFGKITYPQYLCALKIFEEMQFIKIIDEYTIKFFDERKGDLNNSVLFRWFSKNNNKQ